MDPASLVALTAVSVTALITALRSIRTVEQWETGLTFTLGRFTGKKSPGLNFVLPGVQRLIRIDTRVRNRDLPQQAVITADNVTAWIDAVIFSLLVLILVFRPGGLFGRVAPDRS